MQWVGIHCCFRSRTFLIVGSDVPKYKASYPRRLILIVTATRTKISPHLFAVYLVYRAHISCFENTVTPSPVIFLSCSGSPQAHLLKQVDSGLHQIKPILSTPFQARSRYHVSLLPTLECVGVFGQYNVIFFCWHR
jgi:hypothetical protein